jgi:protein phosphatase
MRLTIPEFCLVVLAGATGSGKSTFAARHFKATEIISSDHCRAVVSDDETDQSATGDAFELVHFIAAKRLAARRLTVIDATNVRPEDRKPLAALARTYHALPVVIVFNTPEKLCHERNQGRPNRDFGPHVARNHTRLLRKSLRGLGREGFRYIYKFNGPEESEAAVVERQKLWTDRREETGPFDIIGDVHGCFDELRALLGELGYQVSEQSGDDGRPVFDVEPPAGRKAFFVGDLVDRGPASPDVLRLAMAMVAEGKALCVPGNHENKLLRKLRGRNVKVSHGLAETLAQLEPEPEAFKEQVASFIDGLVSHFVLDGGKLVVAHAGMKEEMQGRSSGAARAFALYGETTGETDEFGLPVRYDWAGEYRGHARVVYGHTPVPEAEWMNRTICIDTGCVFGGKLTALRYPEMELISVPAAKTYFEPLKPLVPAASDDGTVSAQQAQDELLDLEDVQGKRFIATEHGGRVTIREENAAAALEVMSRFAVDPRWLIYLPPTMAPPETSERCGLLEHPDEAFAYFAKEGVGQVICEEKHMGSRAVVIVCRDEAVARRRFGIEEGTVGIIYTRTGRRFFDSPELEAELLERVHRTLTRERLWETLESDWVCLDCELMPWSAKAMGLLRGQYAPVGAAATSGLSASLDALKQAAARGVDVDELIERQDARRRMADGFVEAYRRYCWSVAGVEDLRLAPFHLMAAEGFSPASRDHQWHMDSLNALSREETTLIATSYRLVDLEDETSRQDAISWWSELTAKGGEGMVVKPMNFVVRGRRGLIQPALKCRGREYLRIIYGLDYTAPEHLERLRRRGVARKRGLALREFALGLEGLRRFGAGEALRLVHECVFGVLAMESEPVDPRL